MMTGDFLGMRFFGGKHFGSEDKKKFFEEWTNMSDSEKLAIVNKRIEGFKDGKDCKRDFLSVEHIDAHCQDWMSKTPDEKEVFVEDLKEAFEEHHAMMREWKERFFHHGFGHHGKGGGCSHSAEKQ